MISIELSKDAEKDISNAIDFYDNISSGLGEYFLTSIMSDIESLRIYHGIHIKINNYFRMLSKKFPFAIYYKIDNDRVQVYAVLDCRQDPRKINKRLDKK